MFAKHIRLLAASVLGICALATLILLLSANFELLPQQPVAYAAGVRYVAAGGNCGGPAPCYSSLQSAVDAAADGDEIRVASGTYSDLQQRGDTCPACPSEVVYISKTLTIQGGYTTTNWTTADPATNPTVLDAQDLGQVMVINGNISSTISGLRITRGNSSFFFDVGGGIHVISASVVLSNNTIVNNSGCGGGGVSLIYGLAILSSNIITGNSSCDGTGPEGRIGGGGLYLRSSAATLTGNTINNNYSYRAGLYLNNSTVTLTSNTVSNNYGFGVYLLASNDTILNGNTISRNGLIGVDIDDSVVTLNNNLISNNGWGGVSALYSYVTLTGNTISNNRGRGAYFHKGTAALRNNTIYLNAGFGVYLYALDDALLLHNTIAYNGRGLYQYRRNATLIGNLISHNGNWGTAHGVAMFSPNTANQILINNVIADNGGDMSLGGSNPRLLHTTFARNGGGLSIVSGNTMLTNTILVNEPIGISVAAGSTATLNSVLWFGNGTDTAGAGTINIANPFSGDPAFAADGYHLMVKSAAKDKGVDAGVSTDIDGLHRPSGAAPDLGAVEYYLLDHNAYLPAVSR